MNAYRTLLGVLVVASISLFGCSSKKQVPDPKEPTTEPVLDADPPPERSLKNQAGLIITSDPSVEVAVDDKVRGKTPITVEGLSAGAHDVTFMFEGDDKVTLPVELAEGEFRKVHQSISPDASDARMGGK